MRGESLLRVAALGSLVACLLAVFVPTFVRNVHASSLAEPMGGLEEIAGRAALLGAQRPIDMAYPPSVERTPSEVPRGERLVDSSETWQHPTWRLLGFSFQSAHAYSFSFESTNGQEVSRFVARAFGDLDGDGAESLFEIRGETKLGGEPVTFPLEMTREIE